MAKKYNKEEILALRRQKISKDRDLIFQNNTIINDRWIIQEKINLRRTGELYKAYDETLKQNVIIKTNKFTLSTIEQEAKMLSLLKNHKHYCVGVFFSANPFNFLVTQYNGENLYDIRQRFGSFSLSAVLRIGLQMVSALEELHKIGYIHRDINPSNLCMDSNNIVHIWDLSYARKYLNNDNIPLPQRDKPGFCGDIKYASPRAHKELELCPADDFWSLLYTLLELRIDLPWELNKEKGVEYYDDVESLKIKRIDYLITMHLSPNFITFKRHIEKLEYGDEPNYELLRTCFRIILDSYKIKENDQFDWQACMQHVWKIFNNKSTQQPSAALIQKQPTGSFQLNETNINTIEEQPDQIKSKMITSSSSERNPFRRSYRFHKQLVRFAKNKPDDTGEKGIDLGRPLSSNYAKIQSSTISNISKISYLTNFTDVSFFSLEKKSLYSFKPSSYFANLSQKNNRSSTLVLEPTLSGKEIKTGYFWRKPRGIHELPYIRRVTYLPISQMISQECQVGETLEVFLEKLKLVQLESLNVSKTTLLSKQSVSKQIPLMKRIQESVDRLSQPIKRKKRVKSFVLPFPNYKYTAPEELACLESKTSLNIQAPNIIINQNESFVKKANKNIRTNKLIAIKQSKQSLIESSNMSETLSQNEANKENESTDQTKSIIQIEETEDNLFDLSVAPSIKRSLTISCDSEEQTLKTSRQKIRELKKDVYARLNIKTLPEKFAAQQKTLQSKIAVYKNDFDEVIFSKKELSLATVYMDASSIHIRDKLRSSKEKRNDSSKRHRKDKSDNLSEYLLKIELRSSQ